MLRTAMPGLRQLFQRECAPTVGECGKAHPIDEPGWEAGSRNPNAKPWKRNALCPPCPAHLSAHVPFSLGGRLRVVLGGPGPGQGPRKETNLASLARWDPHKASKDWGNALLKAGRPSARQTFPKKPPRSAGFTSPLRAVREMSGKRAHASTLPFSDGCSRSTLSKIAGR